MANTTNYATDIHSSLSGLASVAYGDPDYFREVKDQIHAMSPTAGLDYNLPSTLISGLFKEGDSFKSIIQSTLERLGSEPSDFKDWVDVARSNLGGDNWASGLSSRLESELMSGFDNNNDYYRSLDQYVHNALNKTSIPANLITDLVAEISTDLRQDVKSGSDIDEVLSAANNNPLTKIDSVPPDTIIPLSNSVTTDKDRKGVPYESGYLTLLDYVLGAPFPKMQGDTNTLPSGVKDSASYGYVGYSPYSLEALYNPGLSENMTDIASNMLPAALDQISNVSKSAFARIDKEVYNISLLTIDLAGYTSFDPKIMSNGDFLDPTLLPNYGQSNQDSSNGSLYNSRERKTTFN